MTSKKGKNLELEKINLNLHENSTQVGYQA